MSAVPALTTERLLLRPLELADAPQIQAIFPQWEIVKYLTTQVPWPYPEDGALTFMSAIWRCPRWRKAKRGIGPSVGKKNPRA